MLSALAQISVSEYCHIFWKVLKIVSVEKLLNFIFVRLKCNSFSAILWLFYCVSRHEAGASTFEKFTSTSKICHLITNK